MNACLIPVKMGALVRRGQQEWLGMIANVLILTLVSTAIWTQGAAKRQNVKMVPYVYHHKSWLLVRIGKISIISSVMNQLIHRILL